MTWFIFSGFRSQRWPSWVLLPGSLSHRQVSLILMVMVMDDCDDNCLLKDISSIRSITFIHHCQWCCFRLDDVCMKLSRHGLVSCLHSHWFCLYIFVWNLYEICMNFVWNLYDISMIHICMKRSRHGLVSCLLLPDLLSSLLSEPSIGRSQHLKPLPSCLSSAMLFWGWLCGSGHWHEPWQPYFRVFLPLRWESHSIWLQSYSKKASN